MESIKSLGSVDEAEERRKYKYRASAFLLGVAGKKSH